MNVKHSLILFMHPSESSFNRSLCDQVQAGLQNAGGSVDVRDIYDISFDPVLTQYEYEQSIEGRYSQDVLKEQTYIETADEVIIIFPVWWGMFPARGKGYLDRVLSYGFAYELEGEEPIPQLNNKDVSLVFTTGAPSEEWKNSGMHEAMVHLIDRSILQFCGLSLRRTVHYGNVIQASDKERQAMLEDVYHQFNQ